MSSRKPLRKIHLDAWLAELQVIMASANLALPFLVALPSDWPSVEDIGHLLRLADNARSIDLCHDVP